MPVVDSNSDLSADSATPVASAASSEFKAPVGELVGGASHVLILIRHAKSDWPDGVTDHERPLAERGLRDAPAVGRWLAAAGLVPDIALVSTARRAQSTWALASQSLAHSLDVAAPPRIDMRAIYGASPGQILDVVAETAGDHRVVAVVGHSPGMESTASLLDDSSGDQDAKAELDWKFPTAGVAVIAFFDPSEKPNWTSIEVGTGRLTAVAVPRG